MKKLLLTLVVFLFCSALFAEPVTESVARQKALSFMKAKGMSTVKQSAKIAAKAQRKQSVDGGTSYYYVFNADDGDGFVVVSGDDRTDEILGYSTKGSFDSDNVPDNMQWWLQCYAEQIQSLDDSGEEAYNALAETKAAVSPLVSTQWNQSSPYNNMCPEINGKKCVTGCIATAFAQIINYFEWPQDYTAAIPTYTTSTYSIDMPELPAIKFDWAKMLDSYTSADNGDNAKEVAKLMLYCGQAVKMDYTPNSSGAGFSRDVLINYFGYDQSANVAYRSSYTSVGWDDLIYKEVAEGRPVLYSGGKLSGFHAFVCDGYDGGGMYHLNWGWGGSSDGYFKLSVLNPQDQGIGSSQGSDGYTLGQAVLIGIQRNTGMAPTEDVVLSVCSIAVAQSEYTRTSAEEDFANVSVEAGFVNGLTNTYAFDYGLALCNGNEILKVLGSSYINGLPSNYSFGLSMDLNFGTGLADGVYQIRSISREHNVGEWKLCTNSDRIYVRATIKGNVLQLNALSANDVDITVNTMGFAGKMKTSKPVEVKLNVTNNGSSTYSYIYLFVDDVVASAIAVGIDPGQTDDMSMHFTPSTAGTKTVKITSDKEGLDVLKTGTLTIQDPAEAKLTMAVKILDADESSKTISGDKFKFNVTVKNEGTSDYDNEVYAIIYKLNTSTGMGYSCGNVLKDLSLSSGKSTTLEFEFDGLEYGGSYFVYMCYYSKTTSVSCASSPSYKMVEPTGIQNMEVDDAITDVYNMNGQKVGTTSDADRLPSGIYIIKGKKIVIR